MKQSRLIPLFLLPSVTSGTIIVCLATIALITSGVLYVTENQLFYDYLFGPQGINTTLLQAPDNSSAIWNAVLGSPFAYYAILAAVAVITGLTIFAILRGITRITDSVHSFAQARLEQQKVIQEMFQRLTVRTVACMATALYWIFFVNVLVPFDVLLLQTGIDAFDAGTPLEGVTYIILAYLLMLLCLHLHVVFARLCLLRIRLFGGYDAQMAAIEA